MEIGIDFNHLHSVSVYQDVATRLRFALPAWTQSSLPLLHKAFSAYDPAAPLLLHQRGVLCCASGSLGFFSILHLIQWFKEFQVGGLWASMDVCSQQRTGRRGFSLAPWPHAPPADPLWNAGCRSVSLETCRKANREARNVRSVCSTCNAESTPSAVESSGRQLQVSVETGIGDSAQSISNHAAKDRHTDLIARPSAASWGGLLRRWKS